MVRQQRRFAAIAALIVVLTTRSVAAQHTTLASLPEEPPPVVQYRLGPVLVNPTLAVPELGNDSNVFNESSAPKEDFVAKFVPQLDLFTDLGSLRVAAMVGTTFTYYHRFESERSISEQLRGRVTARLSRFRPWLGAASVGSNERTAEIDARAKRFDRELAAGAHFDVTPLAAVSVSAHRVHVGYSDADEYRGIVLSDELNRTTDSIAAALRFQATPLTTLTFRGYASHDAFEYAESRDADSRGGEAEAEFGQEAIIRGNLAVGFRQYEPNDAGLAGFRGVTGRGGITTILAWHAMLGVNYLRDLQYSFDRSEGYYVENRADVVYTQRLGGPFDVQVRVARSTLDYNAQLSSAARSEVLRLYHGGFGYSLENGARMGITYEFAERIGDVEADRLYSRQRIFGSFTYEFWK